MTEIRIPDSILPGETVEIDYEILQDNPAQVETVIHGLKQAIATDPRFDYQGSKIITVGDLDLGRDVQLLSIYATLRTTLRAERTPIEYASMSTFEAYMRAAVLPWAQLLRFYKIRVLKAVEVGADMLGAAGTALGKTQAALSLAGLGLLAIAAVIAYKMFVGGKRGD